MTDTPSVLNSAVAETAAAGPTRFTLRQENAGSRARLDHAQPRGPVRRLARVLGRRLTRTVDVDGVLDLGGRRVQACDDQAWGMVQIGHRVWSGRAGHRVEDRLESPAPLTLDPLGLLDSVAGLRAPGTTAPGRNATSSRGPTAAPSRCGWTAGGCTASAVTTGATSPP